MSSAGKTKYSLIMLVLSGVIFGSIGVFRRLMVFPSAFIACLRGLIGAAFIFIWCRLSHHKLDYHIGTKNFLLYALSGAFIGFNWLLLLESYNYTTVPVATLFAYLEPVFVVLMAPIFLSEKITLKKGLCCGVALVGMCLVSGIFETGLPEGNHLTGILLATGCGFFYSLVVILNKKLPRIDVYVKTTIQLFFAGIAVLPYALIKGEFAELSGDTLSWIILALMCLVHSGFVYTMYFGCIENLSAQTVGIMSYIDPVVSLILSALILDEKLSIIGILGAVLILGAACISELSGKIHFRDYKKIRR